MLLYDAIANAQPKPGAFSNTLGCVKRIEDAFGVEKPGPTIMELDTYAGFLAINPHSQDATSFTLLDCVHRIVDDVKEHLLELVRVSNHGGRSGATSRSKTILLRLRSYSRRTSVSSSTRGTSTSIFWGLRCRANESRFCTRR